MANTASGATISKGYAAHNKAPHATLANHGAWYGGQVAELLVPARAAPEASFKSSSAFSCGASGRSASDRMPLLPFKGTQYTGQGMARLAPPALHAMKEPKIYFLALLQAAGAGEEVDMK
jgi:hypothetical protein